MVMEKFRIEHDSIGAKEVPIDAYYGVQSLRAYENFKISGKKVHPEFIKAIVEVKKAAAIANGKANAIDKKIANAMVQACDEILSGKFLKNFIVDAIQGGAGTSLNMNANEVVANRAIEILGGEKGDYSIVHPNDHANCGQSTNDVFPSAGKIATIRMLDRASKKLEKLRDALSKKAREFKDVIKMGRTEMQDAVPISFGQIFSAYAHAIERDIERFAFAVPVYLSNFLGYGDNHAKFTSVADPFAAALWQDVEVLEANMVPTLILNSQNDLWADINSTVNTYNAMRKNNENVYLVIKPNLSHSQQAGAPPAEIYRFGDWVCSGYGAEKSCYDTSLEVTNKLGREYTVTLTVAKDLKSPTATLYYTTEALTFNGSRELEQVFATKTIDLTYAGTDADGNALYSMTVSVPDEAYLYFISYKSASDYDAGISSGYDSAQVAFKGYVYGSSSIVVVNGGAING